MVAKPDSIFLNCFCLSDSATRTTRVLSLPYCSSETDYRMGDLIESAYVHLELVAQFIYSLLRIGAVLKFDERATCTVLISGTWLTSTDRFIFTSASSVRCPQNTNTLHPSEWFEYGIEFLLRGCLRNHAHKQLCSCEGQPVSTRLTQQHPLKLEGPVRLLSASAGLTCKAWMA